MRKKILLISGPQGSGNHFWSKIFALHPDVAGWKDLLDNSHPDNYFLRHYLEPNIDIWDDLDSIAEDIMEGKNYLVISASIPVWNGPKAHIVDVNKLYEKLNSLGIELKIAMLGRDKNILNLQQTRLRGGPSYGCATQIIKRFPIFPHFLSMELAFLYGIDYLKYVSQILDFPIAIDDPRLQQILLDDSNTKYVTWAENPRVDVIAKKPPTKEEMEEKYEKRRANGRI